MLLDTLKSLLGKSGSKDKIPWWFGVDPGKMGSDETAITVYGKYTGNGEQTMTINPFDYELRMLKADNNTLLQRIKFLEDTLSKVNAKVAADKEAAEAKADDGEPSDEMKDTMRKLADLRVELIEAKNEFLECDDDNDDLLEALAPFAKLRLPDYAMCGDECVILVGCDGGEITVGDFRKADARYHEYFVRDND